MNWLWRIWLGFCAFFALIGVVQCLSGMADDQHGGPLIMVAVLLSLPGWLVRHEARAWDRFDREIEG